jgi:hypothetical protein
MEDMRRICRDVERPEKKRKEKGREGNSRRNK